MRFTLKMSAKPVGRNIAITVAAITLSQIAVALILRRVRARGSRCRCEPPEERSGNGAERRGS